LDNRRENIVENSNNNESKNIKKKKRNVRLPDNCDIKSDDIPTYIFYMKANGGHGERFMVKMGGICWKTTSQKDIDINYKLEEAKTFLRNLKIKNPELFGRYSMNGDFTVHGRQLIKSYYGIVQKAGYDNIKDKMTTRKTEIYLGRTPKIDII
jgi:hypothetical protein